MTLFTTEKRTALEAKEMAQWIAFGPVIFQTARILRNSGILQSIDKSGTGGITIEEIASKVSLPVYGVRVLLESGLGMGLVLRNEDKYTLGKTGYFILYDEMTKVNMDFVHDVNYKGLFHLEESIHTGKPVGLSELGNWTTIYQGLSELPTHIQKSWFNFDHYFSDDAFPKALPLVYDGGVKKLLDIGGNTGKWAIASANYREDIQVTIMDLPGQLNMAKKRVTEAGLQDRIHFIEANILDETIIPPSGYEVIWMSQFLDCFSEKEIESILHRCGKALSPDGVVVIMEPFWDMQKFEIAAFCLQQTSIYFTAVANGNSQMYCSDTFIRCIHNAGFEIVEAHHRVGISQSILKCKKIS